MRSARRTPGTTGRMIVVMTLAALAATFGPGQSASALSPAGTGASAQVQTQIQVLTQASAQTAARVVAGPAVECAVADAACDVDGLPDFAAQEVKYTDVVLSAVALTAKQIAEWGL